MVKRTVVAALLLLLAAAPTFAQDPRAEVGVTFGWTFADGVSGNTFITQVGSFNRLDPKDSFSWGVDVGFFVTPQAEVGFRYGNQLSKLVAGGVGGTPDREIGDMNIRSYHGTYTYNFGEGDAPFRPYIFGGLGATSFGEVSFNTPVRSGTLGSVTKFSTIWGAGVKFYGSSKIGGRAGVSWSPVYIKSDAAGWWCDPFWGCYVVGDAQYANQFELNGGITIKF